MYLRYTMAHGYSTQREIIKIVDRNAYPISVLSYRPHRHGARCLEYGCAFHCSHIYVKQSYVLYEQLKEYGRGIYFFLQTFASFKVGLTTRNSFACKRGCEEATSGAFDRSAYIHIYTQTYTIYYFYPSRPDIKPPTTTRPSGSRWRRFSDRPRLLATAQGGVYLKGTRVSDILL
jgi:hypothetical protein